jgi:arabinogalactan endo-1,4-beta-galactosidase
MRIIIIIIGFLLLFSCKKEENEQIIDEEIIIEEISFIKGADISFLPLIEEEGTLFYDENNVEKELLTILKENGLNTIRIKLWKNPIDENASFEQVKTFAERIKNKGLKVWLTVHYSDSWADPGEQETPSVWQNLPFVVLKDSIYNYTQKIVNEINPDYIQIGNEINNGFLFPNGNLYQNENQFIELLQRGSVAVRNENEQVKIIVHYAGFYESEEFYSKLTNLDYDIIGLSYYPWWHGDNINGLQNTINTLKTAFDKEVIIAETSYPFTLQWNDFTNNIIGLDNQLAEGFPATQDGQKAFLEQLINLKNCKGIGYWGAEWVAFRGNQATDGSPWENLALFDFNNKVVKAIEVFNE